VQTDRLLAHIGGAPNAAAPSINIPVILYGAGNLGRFAYDYLKAVGHTPLQIIDRDSSPAEFREALNSGAPIAVSIVTSAYTPIEQALAERGFETIVPFYDLTENYRHLHPLSNGWFASDLTDDDYNNFEKVLSSWGDDQSRAGHLQFLAWRKLREEWNLASMPKEERFFIPEIIGILNRDEIFIDVGAHHGTVSRAFISQTAGLFKQLIAIEPDYQNYEILSKSLPKDSRISTLNSIIAETAKEVTFHDGLGYASQIAKTGSRFAWSERLDALKFEPTFIKLHLEGAELSALKGARKTLLKYRPIIAATVYHNKDGIWKTPLWLAETLPDYKFLFRLHSWCGTGAVIYAIPKERYA
jgi:FkbM family methyltransferase